MGTILLEDSIFAVNVEVTEGTAVFPGSASDGFCQLKRSGAMVEGDRETKERGIFTGTLADADPRLGIRRGKGEFEVEMRASGTEGTVPDYDVLMQGILPNLNTIGSRITTKTGNTGTVLQIQDADIASLPLGACIVVLAASDYWPCVVTARVTTGGSATVTISPAHTGSFADSVQIAKSKTYLAADSGHPSMTATAYWGSGASGGGIKEWIYGARVSSLTMDKFSTGELPAFKFALEALGFGLAAATDAPYTPTYDSGLPGVVLSSKIFKDGTEVNVENVGLSINQPLAFLKATGSANGLISGRAAGTRKISVKLAPYTDGTSVANFTNWEAGTDFSLFGYTAIPHATNRVTLGSVVMFYVPNCFIKKPMLKSFEGVMTDEIEAIGTGGSVGTGLDIAIGFV